MTNEYDLVEGKISSNKFFVPKACTQYILQGGIGNKKFTTFSYFSPGTHNLEFVVAVHIYFFDPACDSFDSYVQRAISDSANEFTSHVTCINDRTENVKVCSLLGIKDDNKNIYIRTIFVLREDKSSIFAFLLSNRVKVSEDISEMIDATLKANLDLYIK